MVFCVVGGAALLLVQESPPRNPVGCLAASFHPLSSLGSKFKAAGLRVQVGSPPAPRRPLSSSSRVSKIQSCAAATIELQTLLALTLCGLLAVDKLCARLGLRRIPERSICLCAVASGPRGALIGAAACCALRHKTRKESFQKKRGGGAGGDGRRAEAVERALF